jgi:antitoxin component HigA of HigAB toxin-antitoxin module
MELQTGLKKILKQGALADELDFQRASVIDRELRLLIKEFPELAEDRKQLRAILKTYEDQHWTNREITDLEVEESDIAEQIAEREREFIAKRKQAIKTRLKTFNLSQKDLGVILGHTSATYMSELIGGVNPFTLNDLIVINRLLNISLALLIPTTLNRDLTSKIKQNISKLNNPMLKLEIAELAEI